jgi:7-cyano-7-deazaguanine reductase
MSEDLTILSSQVREPVKKLEAFPNPGVVAVRMDTEEFTSLCPVTGQPDFCSVSIFYHPKNKCLESKSLKLYLWSFREEGHFNEALAQIICEDIHKVLEPFYICVTVIQRPRGGISISATAEIGEKD